MYQYPEIKGPSKAPHDHCIAFEKLDGSNMRAEWSLKRGWSKFGSRSQLIDYSYPVLGEAVTLFQQKYSEALNNIIQGSKLLRNAQKLTAFFEFYGPNSFAGNHVESDKHDVVLFDFHVHKKGIMSPVEFLSFFSNIHVPRVIYNGVLNASFVQDVRQGKYPVNEGVVCKGGAGHHLWMVKIKTNAYMDKLKTNFGERWIKYGE